MTNENLANITYEELESWLEETFEENYHRMRMDGGHALTPDVKDAALQQVRAYYRKMRDVAEKVTETEVRLTLPEQRTAAGRRYTIEGVVDIVRDNDKTVMYDIKTHEADYVRQNIEMYENQLNVYAHIWQQLRQQPLDETAIIATAFPDKLVDARRARNEAAIQKQMDAWNPLIPIPLDQSKVASVIEDFGSIVDNIESKTFHPPAVEVLLDETAATRQKFGTRVCRNCDARFSCSSYKNFVIKTNARTGIDYKLYYTDFGSDDERAERIAVSVA